MFRRNSKLVIGGSHSGIPILGILRMLNSFLFLIILHYVCVMRNSAQIPSKYVGPSKGIVAFSIVDNLFNIRD